MNVMRRLSLGVFVCAMLFASAAARAQALKQLPADAMLVLKLNNPDAISAKVADWCKRLGVDKMVPPLADPIAEVKRQLNIKEGFDGKGEIAAGLYDSAQPGEEPRVLVLIPVTDYKAFTANLANTKMEGELTSFTLPDDADRLYAANWGAFAAITPNKELLANKPTGVVVGGLTGKQLDSNDITLWVNAKVLSAKALPMLKAARPQMLQGLDQELQQAPGMNPKFLPLIKASVNQLLNGAEEILMDGQAATISLNLGKEGINTSVVAEFEPNSYLGKLVGSVKNANGSMLTGLPARKYFAFGGGVMDPQVGTKLVDDILGPIPKELEALGDDAKTIKAGIEAMRNIIGATNSFAVGYPQPTAPPGQQPMLQQVMVYTGDAKRIAEGSKQYLKVSEDLMKLMPHAPGMQFTMKVNQGAKGVQGVELDQVQMIFNIDKNTPEGAQAAQMIAMMYGPNGLTGYVGAVDAKTYIGVMGGDDELLNATITAAKGADEAFGNSPNIKAVAANLPQNRAMALYIAVDNIAATVLDFMGTMGMKIPLKLPADLPPIGCTYGTEGSSVRIDTHLSGDLIENLVSAGMQGFMMMQGGGQKRGLE